MNFSDPKKVRQTIEAGDDVEAKRSENRRKINDLLNGTPPFTEEEAKQMGLRVRVNFGEGPVLAGHARRQYANAFLSRSRFFKVTLQDAPPQYALGWSSFITRKLNKIIKGSLPYFENHRSRHSAITAHGIAPQMWYDRHGWCPKFVAVDDLRVPTDTQISMENLEWFAVRRAYTPGELIKKVFGERTVRGWNKKAVRAILNEYKEVNFQNDEGYTWQDQPEKMAELAKQNLGYCSSDAVPTIPLWHFYHKEADEDGGNEHWELSVITDKCVRGGQSDEWVYHAPGESEADDLAHLLHVQFGDLNSKPPFLYHSVRSLGFLLMEPVFWTNLLRCRLLQHVFEHLNAWYRVNDPTGRARAQAINLYDKAILPEGVGIVPQNERHQIDPNLVGGVMAQLKQLMQEVSVAYTQELDSGTSKEQTATEVMAKLNQVNALMSGLLGTAFNYEIFAYREICRRFCLKESTDKDVQEFQKACQQFGIPEQFIDIEYWDIEPEVPMGAGNPSMEAAQAQQLLGMRSLYPPEAQQEILHDATVVFTGDPRKAERWVPLDTQPTVTEGEQWAALAFGSLMTGVPVLMKDEVPIIEAIETLLGMLGGVIAQAEQTGGMMSKDKLQGSQGTLMFIQSLIERLAQDPAQQERAKGYANAVKELGNMLKAFAQRLAEEEQAENDNPAELAKAQAIAAKAELDAQIKADKAEMQARQKEQSHMQKLRQKEESFTQDQTTKASQAALDMTAQRTQAAVDIDTAQRKADAEIALAKKKAESNAEPQPAEP